MNHCIDQSCFLHKFYTWAPQLLWQGKSPAQPCLGKWFPNKHADPFSPSRSAMNPPRDLLGPPEERITAPFSTLQDALLLPESPPSVSHFTSWVVLSVNTRPFQTCTITRAHEAPTHSSFLSGAFQGCLSGLGKFSPASPFLCGRQPAGWWYFPECPHCLIGSTAPRFCFLSALPGHKRIEGVGGSLKKVLSCCCP